MDGEKIPIEKGAGEHSPDSASPPPPLYGETKTTKGTLMSRMVDSFKRDPNQNVTPAGAVGADGHVYDVENAAQATANSPLARKLKGRHLQMIAIGGSIGKLESLPTTIGVTPC